MDERTITAAAEATERLLQQALERNRRHSRIYSIIVLGRNGDMPFPITATTADERAEAMSDAGVNLRSDHWAAGYIDDNRQLQICGNNDEAKAKVCDYLRHR